jgi:hypothetical protein
LFDADFTENDERASGRFRLEAAAPGIIEAQNQRFVAQALGVVALLARRTSDGRILDFVHMEVGEVSSIRLDDDGSSPRLVWDTGDRHTLRAIPVDEDRAVLAGARDYFWTTSDATVVRLERASPAGVMDLFPLRAGRATITVEADTVSFALELTVEGRAVPPPTDAGTPEAGTPDAAIDANVPDASAPDASAPDVTMDAGVPADATTSTDANGEGGGS